MNFSTVCFLARKHLLAAEFQLSHAQALELGSAMLGYRTHAALKPDMDGDDVLTEADHAVLQSAELARRMIDLNFDVALAPTWFEAFAVALEQARDEAESTCHLHRTMADFEDFVFQDVQERAVVDDDVLSAYADTNAAVDEFYVDNFEYEPLLQSDGEWVLKASGTHAGELDEDRPYSGHAGNFEATYRFSKDGRSGLVELEMEFGLDFSRDFARSKRPCGAWALCPGTFRVGTPGALSRVRVPTSYEFIHSTYDRGLSARTLARYWSSALSYVYSDSAFKGAPARTSFVAALQVTTDSHVYGSSAILV